MAENKENGEAEGAAETGAAPAADQAGDAAESSARPGRGALWMGLLALIAALAAGAAGGYAYWRLDQRLAGMSEELEAASQRGQEAARTAAALDDELQAVRQGREELAGRTDKLAAEIKALDEATQELFARVEGGPTYWRLERVESLLLAADRVVRLEGDSQAAYAALAEADRMLRALKDPAWLDAREAVQGAMTRLEQVPDPDIPGTAFRLASLADAAMDLPLKRQEAPALGNRGGDSGGGVEEEPPKGMWGKVKAALAQFWADVRGLVRLRRSGKDIEPLLPPDRAVFLRHNLVLNLQAARLAALRGHGEVYRQSLSEARAWVERFFAADSDEVAGMLGALESLSGRNVAPELPKLEEPLRVFRKVRKERQD